MILPASLSHFFPRKIFKKKAHKLNAFKMEDISKAVDIIMHDGIIAFPFNGIYGLFGNVKSKRAAEKIYRAKNRPKDKKLIVVTPPEFITQYAKIDHLPFPHKELTSFWKEIHALGIILPSNDLLPVTIENDGTILTIWTEYEPLRNLFELFQQRGGTAFIGTSANKSGQATHFEVTTLWKDFAYDVDAIIEADFTHLTPERRKSTTVIDMTDHQPRLHRVGNVSRDELSAVMKNNNIPELADNEPLIIVQGREKSD